jgi:roadblock/LC7 domain-containing protein
MSFTMHNKTVNVERLKMIESIKAGLALHTKTYNEALVDFKEYALIEVNKLQAAIAAGDYSKTAINLIQPVSHIKEYEEAIEIFEMSVDENINIDLDTFKAYFKNEWQWSRGFESTAMMYKAAILESAGGQR